MSQKATIWTRIATVHPIGLIPKAPGTFGSMVGVALVAMVEGLATPDSFKWALVALLWPLSHLAIHKTEKLWLTHDDKRIVIDEVLGQAIALLPAEPRMLDYLLAFLLFRFFDIVKPGPIGYIDRKGPGAFGTLYDDVVAGLAAAVLVYLIQQFI